MHVVIYVLLSPYRELHLEGKVHPRRNVRYANDNLCHCPDRDTSTVEVPTLQHVAPASINEQSEPLVTLPTTAREEPRAGG